MENKIILKDLKILLEKIPVNVSNIENCENETYLQNTPLKEDFLNGNSNKKNVSFSNESSILYYDEEKATNIMQSSFSQMFNIFDDGSQIHNVLSTMPKTNAIVVLENLPQTSLKKCVRESNIHDECFQEMNLPVGNQNVKYPIKTLKVLIERLPDNILETHWNHTDAQISTEKCFSGIQPVISDLENCEGETHVLKDETHRKRISCKKKKPKSKKQMRKRKFPDSLQHSDVEKSTQRPSFPIVSETSIQNSVLETFSSTCEEVTKHLPSNEHFSALCNKRLCVHLEKLDLKIPDVDTDYFTGYSGDNVSIKDQENNIYEVLPLVNENCNTVCKFPADLNRISPSLLSHQHKKNLLKRSCKTNTSVHKDFPVLRYSTFKRTIKKPRRFRTSVNSVNIGSLLTHVSKNNCNKLSASNNSGKSSRKCITNDNSSDDDLPLLSLTKNNFRRQHILTAISSKKSQNTKRLHNIPVQEMSGLASDNSSEENDPLSWLVNIENIEDSTSADLSEKNNEDGQCRNHDHNYFRPLDDNSNEGNEHNNSPLKEIRLDHCYHLQLTSNDVPVQSSTPKNRKRRLRSSSTDSSSSTEIQTMLLQNKLHREKKSKQNSNVLKNKKERKKQVSKILASSVFENECSTSKSNKNLKAKSKNKGKKSTGSNKILTKKQAELFEIMLKYLCKQIISNSKSHKKTKKIKKKSVSQCKESQLQQPLCMEPESELAAITVDVDNIKTEVLSDENENCSSEACPVTIEDANIKTEVLSDENENCSSEACPVTIEDTVAVIPDIHTSKSKKNSRKSKIPENAVDKCRLGFLTRNKSLRFYNKCLASQRLLLSKLKMKKKQKKELKKLFKQLKKVCHVKKKKI